MDERVEERKEMPAAPTASASAVSLPGGATAPDAGAAAEAPAAFVNLLGRVIGNCRLYGLHHPLTIVVMEEAYALLVEVLPVLNEVHLAITEDTLLVNGATFEGSGPHVLGLVKVLNELGVASLRLLSGLTPDEFIKVVGLLTANPKELGDKPFAEHLAAAGLEHVGSRTASYVHVYDDQVVVGKKELETLAKGPGVEQILAFLKGEATPGGPQATFPTVQAAANDTKTLADLIMRATEDRVGPEGSGGGESLGDLMVACLRRTFDGLHKDPAVKTVKGRKKLSKTLVVLEATLLQKLRDMAGPDAAAVSERIVSTMEEMRDEIDMSTLVAEYGRRKKAAEASEKRIVRMMEAVGPEGIAEAELADQMTKAGVSPEGWQTLVAKSVKAEQPAATGGGEEAFGTELRMLSTMLTELSKAMEAATNVDEARASEAGFRHLLEKANIEMLAAAGRAESTLDSGLNPPRGSAKEASASPDRRQLLALLASVMQELRQPLSVMTCCLDMLVSRRLGEVSANQEQTLKLAVTSLDRVTAVVGKLGKLAQAPG